jgi:hypothetical protein
VSDHLSGLKVWGENGVIQNPLVYRFIIRTVLVTRPGKRLQFANWKMAIEIVDLPMKNGDFP